MTSEEIERFTAESERQIEADRQLAKTMDNALCSADLLDYLLKVEVVIAGRVHRIESVRTFDCKTGSCWNPINLHGLRDKWVK